MALQDIAGAHREEQTLYEIAQALGSSLGVADAMALIQDKVSRLVPFTTCALFLGDDERRVRVPLRARPRHRSAVQVDAEVVERHLAAAAVVRRRSRRPRRGADGAAAVPADVRAAADWRAGDLPHRAGLLHRRAPPRARPRQRAGRGGDLQLDALRADRARVAHRSADRRCRTAARSIGSSKPGWRAPSAARAASASSSSTSIGSRRSTTPTATKRATARCARWASSCGRRCARTTCARGSRATSSSSCCGTAARSTRRGACSSCRRRSARHPFEPRPGVRVSLSISAGAARFPLDGTTFDELMAAADERMYHDKAGRRSRNSGRAPVKRSEPA